MPEKRYERQNVDKMFDFIRTLANYCKVCPYTRTSRCLQCPSSTASELMSRMSDDDVLKPDRIGSSKELREQTAENLEIVIDKIGGFGCNGATIDMLISETGIKERNKVYHIVRKLISRGLVRKNTYGGTKVYFPIDIPQEFCDDVAKQYQRN